MKSTTPLLKLVPCNTKSGNANQSEDKKVEDQAIDKQSIEHEKTFVSFMACYGVEVSAASLSFLKKNNIVKEIALQRTQCAKNADAQRKLRIKLEDFDVGRLAISNQGEKIKDSASSSAAGNDK